MHSTILFDETGEIAYGVIYDPLFRETIITNMQQAPWISESISWNEEPDAALVFDGHGWDDRLIEMFVDGMAWEERAMEYTLPAAQQKRDEPSSRSEVYS